MSIYTTISNAIDAGWATAEEWADKTIANVAIGEGNCCRDLQLLMLVQWIGILQNYLDWNFDEDGEAIDPIRECVSQANILVLAAKVEAVEC